MAGVVVSRLRRCAHRITGRDAAAGCSSRAQCVLRSPLAFPRILLAVLTVELVVLRVIAEVLPVYDLAKQVLNGVIVSVRVLRLLLPVGKAAVPQLLVQQAADGSFVVVLVGRCFLALEVLWGKRVKVEVRASLPAGVPAVAGADALRAKVGQCSRLVRRGVVVVLFVLQDAHACVRVLLRQLHVRVRELPAEAAALYSLLKIIVGVSRCHVVSFLTARCRCKLRAPENRACIRRCRSSGCGNGRTCAG